jgi:hypothetical protein
MDTNCAPFLVDQFLYFYDVAFNILTTFQLISVIASNHMSFFLISVVTGKQRMITTPLYLILPSLLSVSVLTFYMSFGIMITFITWTLPFEIYPIELEIKSSTSASYLNLRRCSLKLTSKDVITVPHWQYLCSFGNKIFRQTVEILKGTNCFGSGRQS